MSCTPPSFPTLSEGWLAVGWPTVPRFVSVEAEGALLYATTTSTVCRSIDGGRAWEPMLDDLDSPALASIDGGRIVVRGEESWSDAEEAAPVWWLSRDGGTGWSRHDQLPEVGEGRIARVAVHTRDVNGDFTAVSCGDALYVVAPVSRGRAPAALRSADGGLAWTRMHIPPALRQPGMTVRCIGQDSIALERGGAVPLVTAFSRDRGDHWQVIARLPASARGAPLDGARDEMSVAPRGCAPLAGRGVFCEVEGESWASADLGRRWHRATSPVGGRTLPMHGEFLLGVGGGVALSVDAGRRWEMVTVAPGRANLGIRGGVLSPTSYWLAGSALWWSDDSGEHWTASLLPWELVAVLGRQRWVGLRPPQNAGQSCGGTVMLTDSGGRAWRPVLGPNVRRVAWRGGVFRAALCGDDARELTSADGLRWAPAPAAPADADEPDDDDAPAATAEGVRVELRDGALVAVSAQGDVEEIAPSWPNDIVPVAASSPGARLSVVVFGNGTVLRRP